MFSLLLGFLLVQRIKCAVQGRGLTGKGSLLGCKLFQSQIRAALLLFQLGQLFLVSGKIIFQLDTLPGMIF